MIGASFVAVALLIGRVLAGVISTTNAAGRAALSPDMKSGCEEDVTEQIVLRTITDIKRGIELEVWCDVAGETDRRRVFRATLPIDLQAPSLIEIVRVTEDCFVFVTGMNGSSDHFVMLSVIASFDERLRIYVQ